MPAFAFMIAFFALMFSASAEDCTYTFDKVREIGISAAQRETGTRFYDFTGEDAQKLIAGFNAAGEPTAFAGTHFLVIERSDVVSVLITTDTCAVYPGRFSPNAYREMVEKALGRAS